MNASAQIDRKIADHPDWRGELLARLRRLVHEAEPEILEELKWRGAPTWSRNGLVCVANIYKETVKVVFAKGSKLADPDGMFNSELAGNAWRGITFSEKDKINERAFRNLIRSAVELNSHREIRKSQTERTTTAGRKRRQQSG